MMLWHLAIQECVNSVLPTCCILQLFVSLICFFGITFYRKLKRSWVLKTSARVLTKWQFMTLTYLKLMHWFAWDLQLRWMKNSKTCTEEKSNATLDKIVHLSTNICLLKLYPMSLHVKMRSLEQISPQMTQNWKNKSLLSWPSESLNCWSHAVGMLTWALDMIA